MSIKISIEKAANCDNDSCHTNRVLSTRLQVQRLGDKFPLAFSAYGRKFKPPALQVVVDLYLRFIER